MDGAPLATVGRKIALAVAAGVAATTKDNATTAVKDRFEELKKAIARKSEKISVGEVEADPSSVDRRVALGKELDEHGASKDKDVVTVARELLALIKVDEVGRAAVGTMIDDVEKALVGLSDVDVEDAGASTSRRNVSASSRSTVRGAVDESKRGVRSSARVIPEDAHSKTELERLALPIWKRTERFGMKVGVLVLTYVVLAVGLWLFLRRSDERLEQCRGGDKAKCWQIVAAEDTVDEGHNVSAEPLQLLCANHQDACACAGLVYVNAVQTESPVPCENLTIATNIDPQWACKCTRYAFWRLGQQRATQCGVPRCD